MKKFILPFMLAFCLTALPALASENLAKLGGKWSVTGENIASSATIDIDAKNKTATYDNGGQIRKASFKVVLDEGNVISLQEKGSQNAARFTFQDNDTIKVENVFEPDRQALMKRIN